MDIVGGYMKKIFLLIISLMLTMPLNIQAEGLNRGYNSSLQESCVQDGTCLLLCGYTHQTRVTNENVAAKYDNYSLYIYYHYDGFWEITWYGGQNSLNLAKTSKSWLNIEEKKDNVFFQSGVNTKLTEEGICPNNGYIDLSGMGLASEACFDSDGNYCTEKDPGGLGTDFKGKSSESTLEYNYIDHVVHSFENNTISNITKMVCDDVMNVETAEKAIEEQISSFKTYFNGNSMPAFIESNSTFKSTMNSVESKYEERTNICYNQKKEELNDKLKNGQISQSDYNKSVQNLDNKKQQVTDTIKKLDEDIVNGVGVAVDLDYNQGCEVISPALKKWLMQLLDIIKIAALILTLIFGMLDFFKGVASGEADATKKMWKSFYKRLIAVGILFLLPVIIEFILGIVSINGVDPNNPLCGLK